jgi:hypothetical protein
MVFNQAIKLRSIIAAKRAASSLATRPEPPAETPAKQSKASRGNSSATLLLEATSQILATRNVVDVSLSEIAQASGPSGGMRSMPKIIFITSAKGRIELSAIVGSR